MSSASSDSGSSSTNSTDSGLDCVTKLYHRRCGNCGDDARWTKFKDLESEEAALERSLSCDPIVHRHTERRGKWITESFTVQDADMQTHLRAALDKYQDFDPDLENWTFRRPYNALVHRWDRLTAASEAEDADEAIRKLMNFLRPILADSVQALALTRDTGKVDYDGLWQIFPPGELVVTTFFGVEGVGRVTRYEKPKKVDAWAIHVEFVNWNGEHCGYDDTKVYVGLFDGYRRVGSLPVYPLSFHPDAAVLRERLVKRGRMFEALRGYRFRVCEGSKVLLPMLNEERTVSGRVIVDAYAYYHSRNKKRPSLRPLGDEPHSHGEEASEEDDHPDSDSEPHPPWGGVAPPMPMNNRPPGWPPGVMVMPKPRPRSSSPNKRRDGPKMSVKKPVDESLGRCEVLDDLSDEECLLATPWAVGLDLKTKDWAQFRVDQLSEITWNDAAFEKLILPGVEKHLAWSFVKNKAIAGNTFDDFVDDKGRGIIILMFGPPGVGKTYTAEAVAERARVPLYNVSAARLGTDPAEVEEALDEALDLCKLWNAMLLLDEADVFLGARSSADLARNELVAVFLQKLEYYQGICFMTTNRMAHLDHAMQSRVDLFLRYADLAPSARRQVWLNFLAKAGRDRFDVSDAEIDRLAEYKLNGREIKNLVKTAHLLGVGEDEGEKSEEEKGEKKKKVDMESLEMLVQNRLQALEALTEVG